MPPTRRTQKAPQKAPAAHDHDTDPTAAAAGDGDGAPDDPPMHITVNSVPGASPVYADTPVPVPTPQAGKCRITLAHFWTDDAGVEHQPGERVEVTDEIARSLDSAGLVHKP